MALEFVTILNHSRSSSPKYHDDYFNASPIRDNASSHPFVSRLLSSSDCTNCHNGSKGFNGNGWQGMDFCYFISALENDLLIDTFTYHSSSSVSEFEGSSVEVLELFSSFGKGKSHFQKLRFDPFPFFALIFSFRTFHSLLRTSSRTLLTL